MVDERPEAPAFSFFSVNATFSDCFTDALFQFFCEQSVFEAEPFKVFRHYATFRKKTEEKVFLTSFGFLRFSAEGIRSPNFKGTLFRYFLVF